MEYQRGNIFIIDNKNNIKKYVLLVEIKNNVNPKFILINIGLAKPFEHSSFFCIGKPWFKNESSQHNDSWRILSRPFHVEDMSIYGKPIGHVNKDVLKKITKMVGNKKAFYQERERLVSLKNKLHKRLLDLKKIKTINQINTIDYSDIEKEMLVISKELGYKERESRRERKPKVMPTRITKVYLGGRGG